MTLVMCSWLAVQSGSLLKLSEPLWGAVSELPMKRIISGNDHWHCPPWLRATSRYLMSHHLCQSYNQSVTSGTCTVSFVCHTIRAQHATVHEKLVKYAVIWMADEPVKRAAEQVVGSCVCMRYAETCQPASHWWWWHLNLFSSSILYPPLLFHTTLVTHCVVCEQHCRDMWARS